MIALIDNMPLVRFANGEVRVFERHWLEQALAAAAEHAGYPFWWLSEHVAGSVASYLRLDFPEQVIDVSRLVGCVHSVLQVIGYPEVARHFAPQPPALEISLLEIAESAGAGYELAFFHALGARMSEAIHGENTMVCLVDLGQCVRKIRARKTWSRDCDALRAEIVRFVRAQISPEKSPREILLTLT